MTTFARAKWLADRHTPIHQQATLHRFMSEGISIGTFDACGERMRNDARCSWRSLQRHFGDRAQVLGEAAGTHAYVCDWMTRRLPARAERNKVELRRAATAGLASNEYLRSGASERRIRERIRLLGGFVDAWSAVAGGIREAHVAPLAARRLSAA